MTMEGADPDLPFLKDERLQAILTMLEAAGGEARVVGGAVRNALAGLPVSDIDVATTLEPQTVIEAAKGVGFSVHETGIAHGTVTVGTGGLYVEVTTLRQDIETDGRHAVVQFGLDWAADAARRDFTINAVYAARDGTVFDPEGGIEDLQNHRVRFIGDASARIAEDYLRILRFFRFFARFGDGRPDAAALKASAKARPGLKKLSVERVWKEMKGLLGADDPGRALLWMRQIGVLTDILPETEKWGIDLIPGLITTEKALGWSPDPLLRLAAMVPPDVDRLLAMAERLKFSKAETARLKDWAQAPVPKPGLSTMALDKLLYVHGATPVCDRLKLALASARGRAESDPAAMIEAAGLSRLLTHAVTWVRPVFPLGGRDLTETGLAPGPEMGRILAGLENKWVDSGFRLTRDELLDSLPEA